MNDKNNKSCNDSIQGLKRLGIKISRLERKYQKLVEANKARDNKEAKSSIYWEQKKQTCGVCLEVDRAAKGMISKLDERKKEAPIKVKPANLEDDAIKSDHWVLRVSKVDIANFDKNYNQAWVEYKRDCDHTVAYVINQNEDLHKDIKTLNAEIERLGANFVVMPNDKSVIGKLSKENKRLIKENELLKKDAGATTNIVNHNSAFSKKEHIIIALAAMTASCFALIFATYSLVVSHA